MDSGQVDTPEVERDPGDGSWASLGGEDKRARMLDAAESVFAHHGFDAPMPEVARAAGAGVGSLYRLFASKDALIAALAARRLNHLADRLQHHARGDDAWRAILGFLDDVLGDDASDPVAARAVATSDAAEVRAVRARVHSLMQDLLARAIADGVVRPDADHLDLIMVIRAARASRDLAPGAWRRSVQLMLDGLRTPG